MLNHFLLLSALLFLSSTARPSARDYANNVYYVLRHDPQAAPLHEVTAALGVDLVEQAGELTNHWLVRKARPPGTLHTRGSLDPVLETFEALKARAAATPSLISRSEDHQLARRIVDSLSYVERQELRQRVKRAPPPLKPPESSSARVAERMGIHDPLFPQQWHLVNEDLPEHMLNVVPVWEMGLTGKGIISSFVDDGLDYENEDLAANFDAADSHDFNDHVDLPTPKNFDDHHGTRCAGQVAALKNNVCGVGIAYDSKVAGVRILSAPISDVDEAAALNFGFQNVSIYSCSWGPPDNGQAMEGPNYLIKQAVVNGINNGRGGKGSIFVFASGNGAAYGDQCNFDGYTNSIYSVTVSAIDYKGLHPYYSESCAANMIVAYSSGSGKSIVTTDKGKGACASTHGGTSAAAPNAVGVFALALEARPDLTWRDIQHLCVTSSRIVNPEDPDWDTTATGRKYSYKYGYGAIDAEMYVKAAMDWKPVKPQAWFTTPTVILNNGTYDDKESVYSGGEPIGSGGIESKIEVTSQMLKDNNFESLEHIQIKVWIDHTKRGDVEVEVISPKGISSVLGGRRNGDKDASGYPGWIFMSVKHWGEDPVGNWTLKVRDQQSKDQNGTFLGWNMMFWGSTVDPSLALKYEVPLVENTLPPPEAPRRPVVNATATVTTTQHPKPTEHLPGDHVEATGENTKPVFTSTSAPATPTTTRSSPAASSTAATPDPSELGWFSGLSNLVTNQKWFFGALGVVSLFGVGVAVWFYRRRLARIQSSGAYASLAGGNDGDVRMAALGPGTSLTAGQRTTRELYDAFGEVSDDDDDANETTGLRSGRMLHGPVSRNRDLGFHSGFLDDDDPSTAAGMTTGYRDQEDDDDAEDDDGRRLVRTEDDEDQPPRSSVPTHVSGAPGNELTIPAPTSATGAHPSRSASSPTSEESWDHASRE